VHEDNAALNSESRRYARAENLMENVHSGFAASRGFALGTA